MHTISRRNLVGVLAFAITLGVFLPANICQGQKKYDPYHSKVKGICDRAIKYLKTTGNTPMPSRTISALAMVEYYKRYEGRVPTDVKFIEDTVKELVAMIDGDSVLVTDNRETYFPALVLILLAEYDSIKYQGQCLKVLQVLIDRQRDDGSFSYTSGLNTKFGDTSQSQFGALAFYIARQHQLPLEPENARKLLEFYIQHQSQNGTWEYTANSRRPANVKGTNSIHSASMSSVYLLADLLRLSGRVKDVAANANNADLGLPKNVSVYVPGAENKKAKRETFDRAWGKGDKPVVQFDKASLASCKKGGNKWYAGQYKFPVAQWNAYFIYALERYCYFREQAEGGLGGALSSWYDDGVDYIGQNQKNNGALDSHRRVATLPLPANTALYVLFMVRASEVISLPSFGTELLGGKGFGAGNLTQRKDGTISSSEAERSLQGLIDALGDKNLDERQLEQMTEAMKRAIREFKNSGRKSRGEVTTFLKTMISEKNYYRRSIAIKFLAGEQEMDNVPALLYAMGDPNVGIAVQAHDGLRLTSRKLDTFVYKDQGNQEANLAELQRLKQLWTQWFLEIRPDAELLE